jgi:hypothetical protein
MIVPIYHGVGHRTWPETTEISHSNQDIIEPDREGLPPVAAHERPRREADVQGAL